MEMKEFDILTSNILTNLSDQGKVSDYLTQAREAYQTAHTTSTTLQTKQTEYENEIQALKETNMNLFLKIQSPDNESAATTKIDDPEPLTYDKLVDEMGGNK